jgi:diguanylate cyclase (GGDEF)-like protein
MVDVDQFKKVNDRYGHEVGDQVLRMVATKLGMVPGGGRAYRYGGEEFVVIFPGRSMEEAIPSLESLRRAIESSSFILRGRRRPRKKPEKLRPSRTSRKVVSITVSVGVAERDNQRAGPDEVIHAADQALYRAKRSGRNRISA